MEYFVRQVEFAVQMSGDGCANKVKQSLKDVGSVDIDVQTGRVIVNSHLPWIEIQEKIEKTGRRAVLSGFGGDSLPFIRSVFILSNVIFETNLIHDT